MRLWRVDSRNDIGTTNGRLNIAVGLDAVIQNCEHAVKAILNEMIYAQDRGINSFQSVWGNSPNLLSFEASVRTALVRVENVVSVDNFEARIIGDTVSYEATIRSTFGTGTLNGQL